MLNVGLTGPLGSGKSTVAKRLEALGAAVISADEMGHRLLREPGAVRDAVLERYGERVRTTDGIDRKALGRIVFGDEEELAAYNAIIHPALVEELRKEMGRRRARTGVLIVDAALLYEWGIEDDFDIVVWVTADPAVRAARIHERDGLDSDQFYQRNKAQPGPQRDTRPPDYSLTNNGDSHALQRQVEQLWTQLRDRVG